MKCPIQKIVSGGQTGADRAALDWAIERGVPHGGWWPQRRFCNHRWHRNENSFWEIIHAVR